LATDLRVGNCWDGHAGGVHAVAQGFKTRESASLIFLRNGCSARGILVKDANKFRAGQLSVHTSVIATEFTRAYYGHAIFFIC